MSAEAKKAESREPSKHLSGKYEIVGLVPGPVKVKGFGIVDLRTVSLETADKLAEHGVSFLKKVEKAGK